MNVMLDAGAFLPSRAHSTDAGFDIKAPRNFYLRAGERMAVDTGVHIELPPQTVGFVKSRSGLHIKYGITCEGVIDEGYTGSIVVNMINEGREGLMFERGDKIAQLVILPYISPEIEQVDELQETERGANGFGSSGR